MNLGGDVILATEASADGGLLYPDAVHGQSEGGGDLAAVTVRVLGADDDVEDARGVEVSKAGLGLHGDMVHKLGLIGALDGDGGLGHAPLKVALAHCGVLEDVATLMDRGSGGVEGVVYGEDRAQGFKIELDAAQGLLSLFLAFGGHKGDGVGGGADLAFCEHGLVLDGEAEPVGAGYVGGGEDGADAGHGLGFRGVYATDDGVGDASPQDTGVEHAGDVHIADILGGAEGLLHGVDLGDTLTDPLLPAGGLPCARFNGWCGDSSHGSSYSRIRNGFPGLQRRRAAPRRRSWCSRCSGRCCPRWLGGPLQAWGRAAPGGGRRNS